MVTTTEALERMDPDTWLDRRNGERHRRVALMRLRLAVPLAALSLLMLLFQVYEMLVWALIASMLFSYLGLSRKR